MPEPKSEDKAAVGSLVKRLMGQLGGFGGKLRKAREKCRDNYRKAEPEPRNRLRIMIDGLMAMLANEVTTPIANVTEASSYQISLSASYIRTHFVACELIMNGDVVEAFVLVRKQLESLARLNELDSKPLAKLHGKTPNIQNALKGGAGKIYGDLSEIAHFATPRVSEFLGCLSSSTSSRTARQSVLACSPSIPSARSVAWTFASLLPCISSFGWSRSSTSGTRARITLISIRC
jgi:hypothetical protein